MQTLLDKLEIYKMIYLEYILEIEPESNLDTFYNFIDKTSQEVYICGRIVGEEEGKINDKCLLIEISENKRYHLDISAVPEYCLFPN